MNRTRAAMPATLVVVALAGVAFALRGVANSDELTFPSHAHRILALGQVPYRDFFELMTPGFIWICTAVTALVGPGPLLAIRLVQTAALTAAAGVLLAMAMRLGVRPWLAALPGLALGISLYRFFPAGSQHWFAVAPFMAAAAAAMRGVAGTAGRPWAWAGFWAGTTFLLLLSDGAAALTLVAGAIAADALLGAPGHRLTARRAGLAAAGAAVPVALAAAALAAQGALGAAYAHVIGWTLTHYRTPGGYNDVRFFTDFAAFLPAGDRWTNAPDFYIHAANGAFLYLAVVATAVAAAAWLSGLAFRRLRGGGAWTAEEATGAVFAMLVAGSLPLAMAGRADMTHVAMYAPPAMVGAAWLAERLSRLGGRPDLALVRWLGAAALAGFVATGAAWTARDMTKAGSEWSDWRGPDRAYADAPLNAWLRAHARPGDTALAYPDGGAVYIHAVPPASRLTLIVPDAGYLDAREFEALRAQFAADRPRFFVLLPTTAHAIHGMAAFHRLLPAGYRLVTTIPTPLPGHHLPAEIYMARP